MARRFLSSLEKGQILRATVDDVLSPTQLICAFEGELLRINNHTGKALRKGDTIRLQVKNTQPLEFHIFDGRSLKFERVV